MSQYRKLGEENDNMAISYASGLPADHSQALPSFRELLPPHLHDEIESTSYYTSPRHQQSRERPASAASHELTSHPRGVQDHRSYAPPSKMAMADASSSRDYSSAAFPRDQAPMPSRMHGNAAPPPPSTSTPRFSSRGPSPILPPIRDLQSLPDRGGAASGTQSAAFPDARPLSRPDSYAAQEYHHHRPGPAGYGAPPPMGDRRSTDAYGQPAVLHGHQVAYYPGMAYHSDSEQPSPQGLAHAHQSNFGILGDPIDPKNKRRRGNLPKPVTDILRAWFHEHLDHPYPSEEDKQMFMTRTGLTISQISNWFINARRRQLPALRNQMRSGVSEYDPQRQSPFSDVDQTSPDSMPSPSHLAQGGRP